LDDEEPLIEKIESTRLSLSTKTEQLKILKKHKVNSTTEDWLKMQMMSLTHIIEERDKDFNALKKN